MSDSEEHLVEVKGYDPEPFDIADYRQRLRDRTDDYELKLDGGRVDLEITKLREEIVRLNASEWDLQSEIDRLRAALKEIARYEPGSVHIGEYAVALKQYARQVLENQL